MILPVKKERTKCFDRLSYIHSLNRKDAIADKIASSFKENDSYVQVYKNFYYDEMFDIWCYNGTAQDKIEPYKKFLSYPYSDIKFRIGDYVSFDYRNDGTMSHFLIESCDYQKTYDVSGRMWLINQELKWLDNDGVLQNYKAVFQDSLTYTNFKYGATGFIEQNGSIVVLVKQDDTTKNIYINQRFMFSGIPYKVKQILKSVDSSYLEIYLFKTPALQEDNIEDNIAFNGKDVIENSMDEVEIIPAVSDISYGDRIEFSVYNYANGEKRNDTFVFTGSGIDEEFYKLETIGGNNFAVTCLKPNDKNTLSIICKNSESGEQTVKSLWLTEGGWI